MSPSLSLNRLINEQVDKLEEFADHLVECRVVVDEPNHHHRERHFRVQVIAVVSGAELVSGRDPRLDRGEDAYAVVHDSFHALRRQLQEYVQRRRREVKEHSLAHA